MPDSTSISTLILLACASVLLLIAMLHPSSILRWLQRKRYQYEVTFSLYMLTSTEKFIFNSILFLLLSLLIIAASLYLPEHVGIIFNRVLYYFSGDEQSLNNGNGGKVARDVVTAATSMLSSGIEGHGRASMDA